MNWYAISGSWRLTNDSVKKDVEFTVKGILSKGDGIVTGGALGVDYFATQVVIENKAFNQIKIFLPISLDSFCNHYFRRAEEGVITKAQAELITKQLRTIEKMNKKCIYDDFGFSEANETSYYARNTKIIDACKGLYAFQVNKSKGTQDAINKAKSLGKEVFIKEYTL